MSSTEQTQDTRPSFDDWYMKIAFAVAERSDCRRAQVGAVHVSYDNRIVGTGYPGTMDDGVPGCLEGACPRGLKSFEEVPTGSGDYSDCISLHAEMNALNQDRGSYSTMYVTREPCPACMIELKYWEVVRVVWPTGEWNADG